MDPREKLKQLREEFAVRAKLQEQYKAEMRDKHPLDQIQYAKWLQSRGGYPPVEQKAKGGSVIKDLEEYVRDREGEYGAKRVQRAADEIPYLDRMYTPKALRSAFGGDNAQALMTMKPADFEKFAIRLYSDPDTREDEMNKRHEYRDLPPMNHHEYIRYLAKIKGGFHDVPFLEVGRRNPEQLPSIQGHEGRHRTRALTLKNLPQTLVRLYPTPGMREGMPRRYREDFIEAMKNELGNHRLVTGEGRSLLPADLDAPEHKSIERRNMLGGRPQLPEIYADGGPVHLAVGGQGPKNWVKGSIDPVLAPLKQNVLNEEGLRNLEARTGAENTNAYKAGKAGDYAINQWVTGNLGNYVRKQMATHDDPIRKLAEQGIVHMPPEQMGYGSTQAEGVRKHYGDPRLGQSPEAQAWEDAADVSMNKYTVGDILAGKHSHAFGSEPWMEKADPSTKVFHANDNMHANYLGFDHMVDVLKQDLAEGRIRPEQLNKISIEQAVRRVHQYDQERKKAMAETALKATEGMPVHKDYGDGFKWIELTTPKNMKLPEGYSVKPDPIRNQKTGAVDNNSYRLVNNEGKLVGWGQTEDEAISAGLGEQVLKDALKYEGDTMGHCVGGYAPDVIEGRSRIFSLRDAKNEPHVTVEVKPKDLAMAFGKLPDEERRALSTEVKNKYFNGAMPGARDEIWELLEQHYADKYGMPAPAIHQIKGKSNAKPKKDYIPYVQDFVKSGNWSDVGDAQNAELRKYTDIFNVNEQRALEAKGAQVPDHLYLTGDQIQQMHNMITPKGKRLNYDSSGKIVGGEPNSGYAKGGEVKTPNLDTMRLELSKQGMYSPLEKAAMAVPRTKGTPAEFMAEASKQPGYRKEEVDDRRIALPEQKMTKPEFVQHLKKHPMPQLHERLFGGKAEKDLDERASNIELEMEREDPRYSDYSRAAREQAEREFGYDPKTQYHDYQMPGGNNYREVLLKTQVKKPSAYDYKEPADYDRDMRAFNARGHEDYATPHWKGEPNVLAHLRLSDRRGPNNEKLLHVEEVQSDWHQAGREKGYKLPPEQTAPMDSEYRSLVHKNADARSAGREPEPKDVERARQLEAELAKADSTNIPDAPHKKSWHELAMKHVLGEAARKGYHGIVITPGEEQAKRYNMAKHVSDIHYDPRHKQLIATGHQGESINKIAEPHELPNYVGKDVAEKLLQTPLAQGLHKLSGLDLESGGEGMKGFYDKIIPDYLNKLGKPHGAKVGKMPIAKRNVTEDEVINAFPGGVTDAMRAGDLGARQYIAQKMSEANKPHLLHHFPITDSMRKQILTEGLPQYVDGGSVDSNGLIPDDDDLMTVDDSHDSAFGGKLD